MDCKGNGAVLSEEVETDYRRSVLGQAVVFCSSAEFTGEINRFRAKYADKFGSSSTDAKGMDAGEHSLEDTIIFNKYQGLVEGLLQLFVTERGSTIGEFFAECRDAMENKFCALFEEHEHHWFVEMLLDWLDFDHFCESMSQRESVDRNNRDLDDSKYDDGDVADSKFGHK
jgi:hypothetical protein